jgi:hypothetical protein
MEANQNTGRKTQDSISEVNSKSDVEIPRNTEDRTTNEEEFGSSTEHSKTVE